MVAISKKTPGYCLWSFCQLDWTQGNVCLLYTSDAADDLLCVDLGGRRIIKKTKKKTTHTTKHHIVNNNP